MYDVIGDIHGYATRLKSLLTKLGYSEQDGAWSHPERQVIFLGDFVDRGPEQVETVRIAKAMVEARSALAVMGNHEFNAVGWCMPDPENPGEYLREHSAKNQEQHAEFLNQVGEDSAEHHAFLDWFRTLPLYLNLEGLRVVHACWHPAHLAALGPWLNEDRTLTSAGWQEAHRKGSPLYEAVEVTLKGLEMDLPDGISFYDEQRQERTRARVRWWKEEGQTYRDLAQVPDESISAALPDKPIPAGLLPDLDDNRPVFFGHYWFKGEPEPLNARAACLDYSVVAEPPAGKLVAYRWDGEQTLDASHFVYV